MKTKEELEERVRVLSDISARYSGYYEGEEADLANECDMLLKEYEWILSLS